MELDLQKLTIHDSIKILSVDIGIIHLGLCLALINNNYKLEKIVDINLIDISHYTHNRYKRDECQLYHTKTIYDMVVHILSEHPCFDEADIILIERQPPSGLVAIEQIIFGMYRDKAQLIAPNSVHKFLGIGHLDYDNRKIFSEKFAKKYLSQDQQDELMNYERAHDIGDAIEMLVFWTNKKHLEKLKKDRYDRCNVEYKDIFEKLESFRYVPNVITYNNNLVAKQLDVKKTTSSFS